MVKDITNQDIFNLLQDFMQMTSDRFDRLEERMESLEERMDKLEKRVASLEERMDSLEKASREHTRAIQELTARVDKIELALSGIDDDIKYLYKLVEQLKKDFKQGHLSEEETRSRLEEVEAIARQLSLKYGVK